MTPLLCNSGPLMALTIICVTVLGCVGIWAIVTAKGRFGK
jgi:hypothetical protein